MILNHLLDFAEIKVCLIIILFKPKVKVYVNISLNIEPMYVLSHQI